MATSQAPRFSSYFITPSQLSTALESKAAPVPISAAWFLPNAGTTGHASFIKSHIPRSRFFDLDAISDTSSPYPHMLPTATGFASHMSRLGINNDDTVVIYDSPELGLFSAPRVAWTFRVFGHKGGVHVLNNYAQWVKDGLPTASGEQEEFDGTTYEAGELDRGMIVKFEEVKALAEKARDGKSGSSRVLDARSKGRWEGKDPEPRKGLSSGAMPGSESMPFGDVLDGEKRMKGAEELRRMFEGRGLRVGDEIVASCGTGVSAAVLEAALMEAGLAGKARIYDGSWTEWAQRVKPDEGLIVKREQ